jgi:hypothetical protein
MKGDILGATHQLASELGEVVHYCSKGLNLGRNSLGSPLLLVLLLIMSKGFVVPLLLVSH